MSLTNCLGKAGADLTSEDKSAILSRSRELRSKGVGVSEAGKQAVAEQLKVVKGLLADYLDGQSVAAPTAATSTAPEHAAVRTGVDEKELAQIVEQFGKASDGSEGVHHLFDAPAKGEIVRLQDKTRVYHKDHGWMTVAEAKDRIFQWKDHAAAQGGEASVTNGNAGRVVLSLFDMTGAWSKPWEDAGYDVYRFDIQNDPEGGDVNNFSTAFFADWFSDFEGRDIYAILAACPCTDFAVSGARHFAAKDADGRTVASVELVHQALSTIEYFKPAVWAIENPVGRIESLTGLPPWRLSFDPNHLGDPYTKKTLLWGRFNADLPIAPVEPTEGSKMHQKFGGKSLKTKNARSETPEGFSYGFFMANNAVDHPAMAVANKFDRLDRGLIEKAIAAGVTPEQIQQAVEDFYYMEMDDDSANAAIKALTKEAGSSEKPSAAAATGGRFFIQIGTLDGGKRVFQGKTLAEAVGDFAAYRDDQGLGSRDYASINLYHGKDSTGTNWKKIGHVAYNGNVTITDPDFNAGGAPALPAPAPSGDIETQLANLTDDQFDAMFDDAVEATGAPETEKPAKARAKTTKPKKQGAAPRPRKTTSKPERIDTADAESVKRTSGEIAKSLGYNLSSAGSNALEGLTALFGGKGKLSSGLTFDEDSYAKAKPHFVAMLADAKAAGKDLAEFMRSLVAAFGSGVKPYLRRFAAELRNDNASGVSNDLERDGQDATDSQSVDQAPDDAGPGAVGAGAGQPGGGTGVKGGLSPSDARVLNGGATAAGERGDQSLHSEQGQFLLEGGPAGSDDGGRGAGLGNDGIPAKSQGPSQSESATARLTRQSAKLKAQTEANRLPVVLGNAENINETLPYLLDGQREDVKTAENRFQKPDGYGMLFTNGTGTGKTFTGLGIVRRFASRGKTNILIAAPNDKIIEDWITSGAALGLTISKLNSTSTAGGGIVIATYANLGQNQTLADRNWDLVVSDEAHYMIQGKDGNATNALSTLRAITLHPDGDVRRASMIHREIYAQHEAIVAVTKKIPGVTNGRALTEQEAARAADLRRQIDQLQKDVKAAVAAGQGSVRPRALFLSATPFAYEKTVEWANGYLFDWDEGKDRNTGGAYNSGTNRDRFFMQHFGYRMRYNKLTEPEDGVDRGLMQRQFNAWLKKQGVLSGRVLDVEADYDRRFVLLESRIGSRIDALLDWTGDTEGLSKSDREAKNTLNDALRERFDYLSRRYLLEAIKAEDSVDYVRKNRAMGRKVVVFHDYKKGGGFNPFAIEPSMLSSISPTGAVSPPTAGALAMLGQYNNLFADLIESDLGRMRSPIQTYTAEFPGVLLFNGDVPAKQRRANVAKFNDDASGPQVILVQSAAGKEGISLHDTTGKHQRVLLNLGLPTQPTTAIQQEGRIYRTGQVSNAIFRYLNTGTSWEKWAFATTIAQRASAAENLAQGEQARALKDAFIAGFQEADEYAPGMDGEGRGGKQRDKASNDALTEFDRAMAFYWATAKKNSRTKAREGADYFATPEPVGLKMMEWAGVRPGDRLLEPSAGHGAIARWAPTTASSTAIEPSNELASRLAMVFDGEVKQSRFEDLSIVNKYDVIVMNPPFGTGGRTAIDHLDKAVTHLRTSGRDGGRIVALIPTGPSADAKFDKWYEGVEGLFLAADIRLPQVTFERAGTSVATRIVVFDKPAEGQATPHPVSRDLSNATDINELFERIRDMSVPDRPAAPVSAADEAVKEASDRFAAQQASKAAAAPSSAAASAGTFEAAQTTHTKTGADLFVAKITRRLTTDEYKDAAARAKAAGGYYSSFKGAGAIPGFQFKTVEARDKFMGAGVGAASGGNLYSKRGPTFYSALQRAVEYLPQDQASALQWAGIIRNLTQKGVKQEEIDVLGIMDWLRDQTGKISKADVVGYITANQIEITEVEKGGANSDPVLTRAIQRRDDANVALTTLGFEMQLHGGFESARLVDRNSGQPYDFLNGEWVDENEDVADLPAGVTDIAQEYGEAEDDIESIRGSSYRGENEPRYGKYVMPGGENYREILLTLPNRLVSFESYMAARPNWHPSDDEARLHYDRYVKNPSVSGIESESGYRSSHWSEANILAHIRLDERKDTDGTPVMVLQENQSDWHQAGRKRGYRAPEAEVAAIKREYDAADKALRATPIREQDSDPHGFALRAEAERRYSDALEAYNSKINDRRDSVPDAPFKTTWQELAFKRFVRYAVDKGFTKIAWTTGEQQAARYDLSRVVTKIDVVRALGVPGGKNLMLTQPNGAVIGIGIDRDGVVSSNKPMVPDGAMLADVVGKDVADKIMAMDSGILEGLDLKVGGEGMIGFYDDILPKYAAKLGKKWGAKVGKSGISVGKGHAQMWSMEIPPAMAEAVTSGLPLFAQGAAGEASSESRNEAKAWLNSAAAELKGAADIRIVDTIEDLRRALNDPTIEATVEGVYVSDQGAVYLVADKLQTIDRAQRVFTHEVFGHLAMEKYSDIADAIRMVRMMLKSGHRVISELSAAVKAEQPDLSPINHAKEIIALMAERGVKNSAMDRIIAAFKRLLRRLGVKFQYSEAELRAMIARAARALQKEAATHADRRVAAALAGPMRDLEAAESSMDARAMRQAVARAEAALAGVTEATGYLYSKKAPMPEGARAVRDAKMTAPAGEHVPIRDRLRGMVNDAKSADSTAFKQGLVDFAASIEKYERALNGGNLLDAAKSIYKQVLSTQNLGSVMVAVMKSGIPKWVDGAYQIVSGRKGLTAIFEPLSTHADGNLSEHFELYAAARRASRLINEKNPDGTSREKLFTAEDIATGLALAKRYPVLERVFDDWQVFNAQALDMMQEAGLIDPEARKVWERNDYVPFYRAMDDAGQGVEGPSSRAGVANQSSGVRTLTGGENKLGNIIENMMMNVAHAVDASYKNRAAMAVADTLEGVAMTKLPLEWKPADVPAAQLATALRNIDVDVSRLTADQRETWARVFRPVAPAGKNVVTVMRDGKAEYYEVIDPLLLRSLTAMRGNSAIKSLDLLGMVTGAKRLLTKTVTAHPHFIIANFVRDTLSTWVQSPLNIGILTGAYRGFRDVMRTDKDFMAIMAAGGGGGHIYDTAPAALRKMLTTKMPGSEVDGFLSTIVSPKKLWSFYRQLQLAAENANRLRVYRAALASGASQAEAVYQARDVLNFSLRGDHAAVEFLSMSVPFFNARLQGLYRLQRGYKENREAFLRRGLMLMGATLALLAANWDDDRYQDLQEWDRDTYWHVWLGDQHWRIPKPFEVGVAFATAPERAMRAMLGEDDARIVGQSAMHAMKETFAFNPIPQLFKPMYEQYQNKSFFTDRPIVGLAQQGLKPEGQYNERTSATLVEIAKAMPGFAPEWLRSPMRLEALVRGYLGSMGMASIAAADGLTRGGLGYPDAPHQAWHEIAFSRFLRAGEPHSTKYTDELYRMAEAANDASKTVNAYVKQGRIDEAKEARIEYKDQLKSRERLNKLVANMRKLSQTAARISNDPDMDSMTKRRRLDEINARRNDVARLSAQFSDYF